MEQIVKKMNFKMDKKNGILLLIIVIAISYIFYKICLNDILHKISLQEIRMQEIQHQVTLYETFALHHQDYDRFINVKSNKLQVLENKLSDSFNPVEEMQRYYQLAGKYHVNFSVMKLLPEEKKDRLFIQKLQITITGNFFDVLKLLTEIETSERLITLNKVYIEGDSKNGNIKLSAVIKWYILK